MARPGMVPISGRPSYLDHDDGYDLSDMSYHQHHSNPNGDRDDAHLIDADSRFDLGSSASGHVSVTFTDIFSR